MNRVLLLVLLLITQGCASISKERCEAEQWDVVGKEASLSGIEYEEGKGLMVSCSSIGAEVSEREYKKGYQEGLSEYCQLGRASWFGLRGKVYNPNICPRNRTLKGSDPFNAVLAVKGKHDGYCEVNP